MRERLVKIRAIYPLYPPIRLHSEDHVQLYDDFIEKLRNPMSVSIRGSSFHDQEKLSVRVVPCSPSFQKKLFAHGRFRLKTKHLLEFSGSFRFPGTSKYFATDHTGKVIAEAEKRLRLFWLDDLPEYLDPTIQTFLCAAIIAFPGAVYPTGNIWFRGNVEHRFSKHYVSPIQGSIDYLRKNNLHPFPSLNLENAVKWPAPGSEDTELGVLMGPEVRHGEAEVYARVQA